MTMETASLRTLSPNTSMLSVGLTSIPWKMASVATGSTADIKHPNAKLRGKEGGREGGREGEGQGIYIYTHTHTLHIHTYTYAHKLSFLFCK